MSSPSHSNLGAQRHCLLSNGTYSVMLGESGSGFSRWRDRALTRWREDVTRDAWGTWLLLRDEDSGAVWSASRQPYAICADEDEVTFGSGCATFRRRCAGLASVLDVAVAADADIELRRLVLTSHSAHARTISVTSYAELVVGAMAADDAHPAFSKMFVQTGWDARRGLLLATRRRRAQRDPETWVAQTLQVAGEPVDARLGHETDRARFLGRGRTLRNALAMQPHAALSSSTGCVLDPVFSLRREVRIEPGASKTLLLWTRASDSRDGASALDSCLRDAQAAANLFAGARAHAEATRERFGIRSGPAAAQCACWLDAVLLSDPARRAAPAARARGRGGPPTLWSAGISGDRPILLQCLGSASDLACTQELLLAQALWRSQRLAVDVVLLNAAAGAEGDQLQAELASRVNAQQARLKTGDAAVKAEVFALRDIGDDLRDGLLTVARVVLGWSDACAADAPASPAPTPAAAPLVTATTAVAARPAAASPELEFDNGFGGFGERGDTYRIRLDGDRCTPAPWVNVIANPGFGCLLSAEGGGYSWSLNSQQNPLTPWPNDPVSDSPHDVLYLRDEDTGAAWSATALPMRVAGAIYDVIHGKGYSRFCTDAHDIELELTVCVPIADPLKLSRLRLRNRSARARRLVLIGYVEWALGANGTTPAAFVVTSLDERTGAVFARNRWRSDFDQRVAFYDLGGLQSSLTGDRTEFLGRFGGVDRPAALAADTRLSGRLGAGLDPCTALQTRIELPPGTQFDVLVLLGDAAGVDEAQELIEKYRASAFDDVLAAGTARWRDLLDAVQVRTPDRATDILLNGWLLYQALGCRVWARTAYYQASGAYGFRDQLQDVMALCVGRPDLAREHLLRAAGRQFAEGDVQHWWLPPAGAGIRTRISDDRVWLAFVAAHYVGVTGDDGALDVELPFLAGQAIAADASEAFFRPEVSSRTASVYEHCALAIDSSLTRGAHGLPLIGTGDWNDGMNAVGAQGRGESSWLGWFLLATIDAFAALAERRGDHERVARWRDHAAGLRTALERAWDGRWYRRGYYDDGSPLGSHENDECRIDTIAQSWSALAGAQDPQHSAQAMASVDRMLVDRDHRIALLFTPPFDRGAQNPGYIKGYPPGVRENGGQYTHGAIWSIFAWTRLGDGDRAGELFDMLNPIRHSDSAEAIARYKVEPYVSCADVYSVDPHAGRGGWTWYSGSAAWLYRAGLEALLGFHLQGDRLRIDPCIPAHWPGFELTYRRRGPGDVVSVYRIGVENPRRVACGVAMVELDGHVLDAGAAVALADDGGTHVLRIVLGPESAARART